MRGKGWARRREAAHSSATQSAAKATQTKGSNDINMKTKNERQ